MLKLLKAKGSEANSNLKLKFTEVITKSKIRKEKKNVTFFLMKRKNVPLFYCMWCTTKKKWSLLK